MEVVQQDDTPLNRRVNDPTVNLIDSENDCAQFIQVWTLLMNTFGPIEEFVSTS